MLTKYITPPFLKETFNTIGVVAVFLDRLSNIAVIAIVTVIVTKQTNAADVCFVLVRRLFEAAWNSPFLDFIT